MVSKGGTATCHLICLPHFKNVAVEGGRLLLENRKYFHSSFCSDFLMHLATKERELVV